MSIRQVDNHIKTVAKRIHITSQVRPRCTFMLTLLCAKIKKKTVINHNDKIKTNSLIYKG